MHGLIDCHAVLDAKVRESCFDQTYRHASGLQPVTVPSQVLSWGIFSVPVFPSASECFARAHHVAGK